MIWRAIHSIALACVVFVTPPASAAEPVAEQSDQQSFVVPPSRFAKEFDAGLAAYDRGDYRSAYDLWLPIAQQGDLAAMRNVAHLLRHGQGVPRDLETAARWYSSAAQRGLTGAQVNLAEMFYDGEGIPQSYEMAAQWYARAARAGHAHAQYKLARMIELGQTDKGNDELAKQLYRWALEAGHSSALERYRVLTQRPGPVQPVELSTLARDEQVNGRGSQAKTLRGPGDPVPASLVMNKEDRAALEDALTLFVAGRRGDALKIWRRLALAQNAEAQYRLGMALIHGQGASAEPVEGKKWLDIAATLGHDQAGIALANLNATAATIQPDTTGSPM